jgi:hypothetical protein
MEADADLELVEAVGSRPPPETEMVSRTRIAYGFRWTEYSPAHKLDGTFAARPNRLTQALSQLGLMGRRSSGKFIPQAYLRAPVNVRVGLLQGLLDTDGCPAGPGQVEFTTVSAQLATDIVDVARSLGGTVSRSQRRPSYSHAGERLQGQLPRIGPKLAMYD